MFYSWLYGSFQVVEETYIFHKLEIIRIINESIAGSAPMTKEGIIEGINSLSLTEVCNDMVFCFCKLQHGPFAQDFNDGASRLELVRFRPRKYISMV